MIRSEYSNRYITPFELPEVSVQLQDALEGQEILVTGSQGMLGGAIRDYLTALFLDEVIHPRRLIFASRKWANQNDVKTNPKIVRIENTQISEYTASTNLLIHTASPSNITKIASLEELKEVNSGVIKHLKSSSLNRIIYISSGEVYRGGNTDESNVVDQLVSADMRTWYPAVKQSTENLFLGLAGVDTTVVRLFHTFGPGISEDDGRSFGDILWAGARGRTIHLKSDGSQVRSFLYLADAVSAICKLLERGNKTNQIYNLGSSDPVSILDFAKLVSQATNVEVNLKLDTTFQHSPNQVIVPTTQKLRNLGWTPDFDLNFAVKKTVDSIRNSLKL